jgi:hypothetical protein
MKYKTSIMILVGVSTMLATYMLAQYGSTDTQEVNAKYSNTNQEQFLYNDCQTNELSGGPNCANNGVQTQTDGGITTLTNFQASDTDTNYRSIGDRNIGQQNTGETKAGNQASDDEESGIPLEAYGGNAVGEGFNCEGCNTANPEESLPADEIASTDEYLDDQGINSHSSNLEDPFILPLAD